MGQGIIFAFTSCIMFLIAYLLYFKGAYWLISGINFIPQQTAQKQYDLRGLTRFLGVICALIGIVMMISGVAAFFGKELQVLISLGFVFILVPVALFGSERYMYVVRSTQRIINIVITVFMIATAVFTAVMILKSWNTEL